MWRTNASQRAPLSVVQPGSGVFPVGVSIVTLSASIMRSQKPARCGDRPQISAPSRPVPSQVFRCESQRFFLCFEFDECDIMFGGCATVRSNDATAAAGGRITARGAERTCTRASVEMLTNSKTVCQFWKMVPTATTAAHGHPSLTRFANKKYCSARGGAHFWNDARTLMYNTKIDTLTDDLMPPHRHHARTTTLTRFSSAFAHRFQHDFKQVQCLVSLSYCFAAV